MIKKILNSVSPDYTRRIGENIGRFLKKYPAVILMTGDLGTGKTTMSQSIVFGYGISSYVTSPSFTLVNIYEYKTLKFYHFDLYRLSDIDELFEIGFDEILGEKVPMIIEWPEMVSDYNFESLIRINLFYSDVPDQRRIEIETNNQALEKELSRFE